MSSNTKAMGVKRSGALWLPPFLKVSPRLCFFFLICKYKYMNNLASQNIFKYLVMYLMLPALKIIKLNEIHTIIENPKESSLILGLPM